VADVPERGLLPDQLDQLDDAIDFSLVHADDEFLDALGSPEPGRSATFADDRLAALLLSWRDDVDAEPIGNLVEPKLAVATVRAARARQRRGPRLLAPLAAAAAILAIAFAGVGLAAHNAQPGDTLWGLARVLYADHARSVEAAQAVRTDLSRAQEALASGKVAEAKSMLDQARQQLPTVASEDGKDDLQARHAALEAKLPGNPAVGASPPPAASPTTALPSGSTGPTTTTPDPTTTTPTSTTDPATSTTTTTTSDSPREETTPNTAPNGNGPNDAPRTDPATEPATQPATQPASNPAVTSP
jgi:hypothetical protein